MTLSLKNRGPLVTRHRKPKVSNVIVFEHHGARLDGTLNSRRKEIKMVESKKLSGMDVKLGLLKVIADEAQILRDCLLVCKRISTGLDDSRSWDALDITADGAESVRVRLSGN